MVKERSQVTLGKIVEKRIFLLRGHRVMLDSDLADLYRVETGHLNRAVKRNVGRFPEDFAFQLTYQELTSLRCHFGISNAPRGGRRYLPFVFTEQGIAMLSTVLNSEQAIQVNIVIMRTFVRMKEVLSDHRPLLRRVEEIEARVSGHDDQLKELFKTLKEMIPPAVKANRPIGIRVHPKE